jgi:hypothetical protein
MAIIDYSSYDYQQVRPALKSQQTSISLATRLDKCLDVPPTTVLPALVFNPRPDPAFPLIKPSVQHNVRNLGRSYAQQGCTYALGGAFPSCPRHAADLGNYNCICQCRRGDPLQRGLLR